MKKGIELAKKLGVQPPNILTPPVLASQVLRFKGSYTLSEADLRQLGANLILSVGEASAEPTSAGIIEHFKGKPKVALIGKGVTYDSGGLSIKDSHSMEEMKYDMLGAATVLGVNHHLDKDTKVVSIIGCAENVIGPKATRPGDVIRSLSGQTVEILNTDAEGRLVLADCITMAKMKYFPKNIVTVATLTGAVDYALGPKRAGFMTNSPFLRQKMLAASKKTGEKVWELPLGDEYREAVSSKIAHIANVSHGNHAGASTAASFLEDFASEEHFLHLDIAAVAYDSNGPTGFGVNLLSEFINSL